MALARVALCSVTLLALGAWLLPPGLAQQAEPDVAGLRARVDDLGRRVDQVRERVGASGRTAARPALVSDDLWADAAIFVRGARWALDYEPSPTPADLRLIARGLDRCRERLTAIESGQMSWQWKSGSVVRGYRSRIDGSAQPFGVIVPRGYTARKKWRLDVVLHGSTRPVGMSELRFMNPFDGGDAQTGAAPEQDWIELRPLGRVENCYRWAGETDVFEAIESVCRSYSVDRSRIVLRGMSMGASGTWHLGLKHPGFFAALGPYCGYVDTHQFSLSPIPNFVKVGELPDHQERGLHMLDSVDYAANAGLVPAVAAIGEKDPFFQAHVIMGEAFRREGLEMVNLISPGTAHVQDPKTWSEQMRRIAGYLETGRGAVPEKIRFVTWTLKYPRYKWLEARSLARHYDRTELRGERLEDGSVRLEEPVNVTRLALHSPALSGPRARLWVGEREIAFPRGERPAGPIVIVRNRAGRWRAVVQPADASDKIPGLQGPIDDAFTEPFLCVRGTGSAWNPAVGAWAEASLKRFQYEWRRYFRGELPLKSDTEVTEADLRDRNLIVFGDPGSNRLLRKALDELPLRWDRQMLRFRGERYAAAEHAPAFITRNPLSPGRKRYLVVNSGHTFRESELNLLNYLLFPRLGDWAVMRTSGARTEGPWGSMEETAVKAGYFDEHWR